MNKSQKNQDRYSLVVLAVAAIIGLCCSGCGKGNDGAVGPQGSVGVGCTTQTVPSGPQAPNGGALITCGNTQSMILNGSNGAPGAQIVVKKLCPGVTVYPSKFIEVTTCIDNKLYGVYSANGGFYTELPPGYYTSDGINASCNFTVGTNCAILN